MPHLQQKSLRYVQDCLKAGKPLVALLKARQNIRQGEEVLDVPQDTKNMAMRTTEDVPESEM